MSSSSATTYLVVGATRGIGRAVTEALLQRTNVIVIAAVRTTNDDDDPNVASLRKSGQVALRERKTTLIIVKLDISADGDAEKAVDALQRDFSVKHIDVVICNASINNSTPAALETDAEMITKAIQTNTIGPLLLFKASRSLLLASRATSTKPKFVIISSGAGTFGYVRHGPISNMSYCISKAGVNVLGVKLAREEKDIITFLIHPGHVDTEGQRQFFDRIPGTKERFGHLKATPPDECAAAIVALVDRATEEDAAKLIDLQSGRDMLSM